MGWWQKLRAEDALVPTPEPRSALSLDEDVRSLLGAGALDWAHALAVEMTREYVEVSFPSSRVRSNSRKTYSSARKLTCSESSSPSAPTVRTCNPLERPWISRTRPPRCRFHLSQCCAAIAWV
jgi:hypothetical protein